MNHTERDGPDDPEKTQATAAAGGEDARAQRPGQAAGQGEGGGAGRKERTAGAGGAIGGAQASRGAAMSSEGSANGPASSDGAAGPAGSADGAAGSAPGSPDAAPGSKGSVAGSSSDDATTSGRASGATSGAQVPPGRGARTRTRTRTTLPGFAYTEADEEKQRGVRRMKLTALGLLVFVAIVFALATWAGKAGAGPWTGYVAAAAEAGMVGALADWFAVTALFRHPLGIPIPHTAIIPNKKDQLGASLGSFVGENFLSGDVVRARLRALGIGGRLGSWLAEPAHADRVTAELSTALRGALTVLRDSDVQAVVAEAITRRADNAEIAPGVGKTLQKVVADGAHHRAVDLVCARAHDWLVLHSDSVMDAVEGGAPGWTPRFVDRKVGERVYRELLRFVTEMRDMPGHPARGAIDRFLTDFAADLQSDTDTRARVERMKSDLLARSEVQDVIASAWSSVRAMIMSAAEDDRSELRLRARSSLLSLGARLASDGRLQAKLEGWIEDAAVYVVTTYRAEITSLISDTVASWDAEHTSRKIEAHIGRDLQFIRINGTVVGALAGLLIYTVAHALGG